MVITGKPNVWTKNPFYQKQCGHFCDGVTRKDGIMYEKVYVKARRENMKSEISSS